MEAEELEDDRRRAARRSCAGVAEERGTNLRRIRPDNGIGRLHRRRRQMRRALEAVGCEGA